MRKQAKRDVREELLEAATASFARFGYAGTSIEIIMRQTTVTRPMLYYHFKNKAGLFKAVVDHIYDECFARMEAAAQIDASVEEKLVEVATALFEYLGPRKEYTRLAIATAYASPEELPEEVKGLEKGQRNFDVVAKLVQHGIVEALFRSDCNPHALIFGIYGVLNFYLMAAALSPDVLLDRSTAREMVDLFLRGAIDPASKTGEWVTATGEEATR